jgi:hypothetical protein
MTRHESLKCVGTQRATPRTGEDWVIGFARLTQQPLLQDSNNVRPQRCASHLSSFAKATDVSACAKRHILTPEGSQFTVAQACLNRDKKQRSIPVADPCSRVGRGYERCGFVFGEKLDRPVFATLRRNRKDPLALQTQRRLPDRGKLEEGVHGREARIARAHGVAPILFEVPKKLLDEGDVKLFDLQR